MENGNDDARETERIIREFMYAINLEGDFLQDETAGMSIPDEYCF